MSELKVLPCCVEVKVTSEVEGVLKQEIIVREYSLTAEEHITKNFIIAEGVKDGVKQSMTTLAEMGAQGGSGKAKG
jgi:hypothetical protein